MLFKKRSSPCKNWSMLSGNSKQPYCDMVCYQEGKGDQFPYPTVFESTGPKDWPLKQSEWRSKATRTPWPIISLTGKGMQVTPVAWPEEIVEEEKKQNDWPEPLVPKWYLFVRGNWEKNLQFEDSSRRIKTQVYSQNSGWSLTCKKKNV